LALVVAPLFLDQEDTERLRQFTLEGRIKFRLCPDEAASFGGSTHDILEELKQGIYLLRELCKTKGIDHRFLPEHGVPARAFARSKNRAIFCWLMGLDTINSTFAGVHPAFLPKGTLLQEHERSRLVKDIDSDLILFAREHFVSASSKIESSA